MIAVWGEMNVVLADQFRDGNVPAQMAPLPVAQAAFATVAQAGTVQEYYFRGDSACHEGGLLNWLRNEKWEGGPQGFIGFAVSARMSEVLHAAILRVPEKSWEAYGPPHPREIRKCAEVTFVSAEKSEHKDRQPLRYMDIRIRNRQDELFQEEARSSISSS